jgi:hypothetical protein
LNPSSEKLVSKFAASNATCAALRRGYERAARVVGACGAGLSDDELAAVTGGNIAALFPGGWY